MYINLQTRTYRADVLMDVICIDVNRFHFVLQYFNVWWNVYDWRNEPVHALV